jgi:hypothetical protein
MDAALRDALHLLHRDLVDIETGLEKAFCELNPTPSSAGAATASSPLTVPFHIHRPVWEQVHRLEERMRILEVAALEAGRQSPPSGRPTTEEVPPGETPWTTTEDGWDVRCESTPTRITFTIRRTLLLPQPDQILPGPVEFA